MSSLLVVQPDTAQAHALRKALRGRVSEDVIVVTSVDDALASIDQRAPDVILLPTLIPAVVEDYLIAYLATLPGVGHVQILGLPRLERAEDFVVPEVRSLLPWRRRERLEPVGSVGCDPEVFTQDVIAYLAGARALKKEIERSDASGGRRASSVERRRDPRFADYEVPWISVVSFAGEPADLINVSSRGALLRTGVRPEHYVLRRSDQKTRERARVVLELESASEVLATGRVIRCLPLRTTVPTQYEIAFAFDDAVGLHLPAGAALAPVKTPG